MGILLHAKVIIISYCKNKICIKQFNNCKWVLIIQIIDVNNYVLFLYMIVKRNVISFGIKTVNYLIHGTYNLMKTIKLLIKLI